MRNPTHRKGTCRVVLALLAGLSLAAHAGDFRISLPKRSPMTPVQQLNREGVREAKHGHLLKAKQRFIKAYLLDPDDPFTLNNLGYIAELEGDVDRALRYYELAGDLTTEAAIDQSTNPGLKGQPVAAAFRSSDVSAYHTNQANFRAMDLIGKGRILEAELVLRKAVQVDSKNPFLLVSLGYVMESEGDLRSALQFYTDAANLHSNERVSLTPVRRWRGKSISDVAARSANAVRDASEKGEDTDAQVTRLNLQGVSALNHADAARAQNFFANAYRLDPHNAFTLNNLGYMDELNGDRETAEMYYEAARTAQQANDRVTYSTRKDAEGRRLGSLAESNENEVDSILRAIQERKRRVRHPIQLRVRNNAVVAPVKEEERKPPLSVPAPPLPLPQLPERDLPPTTKKPGTTQTDPGIQLITPNPQSPPSGQASPPQANR